MTSVVQLAASMYYGSLRALGATALRRRLHDAGLILCYHNVVPRQDPRVGDRGLHLPVEQFERQMRWLVARYDVISLRELADRLERGTALRSTAAVTFDDGYAGVFEYAAPVLETLRIPATVFVVAEAPGRSTGFWWDQPEIVRSSTPARREKWLRHLQGDETAIRAEVPASAVTNPPATHRPADWATIRAHAGRGIDIGVHSLTHRALPTLTESELEQEALTSRGVVYRATGSWPEFFSYPYGLWDSRIHEIVRKAGYRAAVSLGAGLNEASADLWRLRRVNIPVGISSAAFEAWSAGLQIRRNN